MLASYSVHCTEQHRKPLYNTITNIHVCGCVHSVCSHAHNNCLFVFQLVCKMFPKIYTFILSTEIYLILDLLQPGKYLQTVHAMHATTTVNEQILHRKIYSHIFAIVCFILYGWWLEGTFSKCECMHLVYTFMVHVPYTYRFLSGIFFSFSVWFL